MGCYRRRLDIIADVLSVARQDAKKTQIMYQANLSYKLLKRYLNEIVEASLVRFNRENRCYMLTSKGQEFLEKYKKYSRRNKHVERQLRSQHDTKRTLEELCSSK